MTQMGKHAHVRMASVRQVSHLGKAWVYRKAWVMRMYIYIYIYIYIRGFPSGASHLL